jgi:excisionase family DNA binding protein
VKTLLTASALIEASAGLALVAFPSLAATLLLGSSLDTPVALVDARMQSLLTVRQVAKLLGVCSATVYRLCGRGELPHFRVLNVIRSTPGI